MLRLGSKTHKRRVQRLAQAMKTVQTWEVVGGNLSGGLLVRSEKALGRGLADWCFLLWMFSQRSKQAVEIIIA